MAEPTHNPRCILALDLGTTTGWALRGHDGLITSGTASFRPGRFDGGGMRYLRFANWLGERISLPFALTWMPLASGAQSESTPLAWFLPAPFVCGGAQSGASLASERFFWEATSAGIHP